MSLIFVKTFKVEFLTKGIPNPIGDALLQKVVDAFVDDADLWDICPQQLTSTKLLF